MSLTPFRLISDVLSGWALDRPDQDFLVFDGERYSFDAANHAVDHVAKGLIGIGVNRGDRVACYGTPRPEAFISFLAATSVGAIWVGLNPKYTQTELDHVMTDAQPDVVFVACGPDEGLADAPDLLAAYGSVHHVVTLAEGRPVPSAVTMTWVEHVEAGEAISGADLVARRDSVEPRDPAFLVYTSGSTGRPKGAVISHYATNTCNHVGVDRKGLRDRTIICNLPINHVGAILDICARTMMGGGTIFFQEAFDPEAMMRLIEEERINTWGGVPTIFQMCVNHPSFADADLSSVDLLAWGGAAMPAELLGNLMTKTDCSACTMGYGSSETVGGVTFSGLHDSVELLSETVGTPDDRLPIRIWHTDDRLATAGEPGEIQVHADFVMSGYWNRPEETEAAFEDGWLLTGDLAVMRDDGYVEIVGRLSEMFKSGGYNVYPREVELQFEAHPSVAMCAVVSVPDETFQEVGHAYVMVTAGTSPAPDELRAHARTGLANYKLPKQIFLVDELPMLPIGKVDKVALTQRSLANLG